MGRCRHKMPPVKKCWGGAGTNSLINKYNRPVELKEFVENPQDELGGIGASVYNTIATIYCQVKPVRGAERLTDERITEFVNTVFKTRYDNVTQLLSAPNRTEWKLTYDGVDYDITHIIDVDEAHNEVEIYALRGEAA